MLAASVSAVCAFQPGLMRPQHSPSKIAPRAIEMLDPGLVDADMIGRASVFGLCCYTVMQFVDPPSYVRHRRPAVAQPDDEALSFGWLNADMSVPLPTLQALEDSCVRVGKLRGSTFYLCKQKSEGFQACELSVDFTQHYGENVYVCRA
tara:strand:- start:250 stop:696 length:447 start_codon:yes stop_codon:yes gene_type:complete